MRGRREERQNGLGGAHLSVDRYSCFQERATLVTVDSWRKVELGCRKMLQMAAFSCQAINPDSSPRRQQMTIVLLTKSFMCCFGSSLEFRPSAVQNARPSRVPLPVCWYLLMLLLLALP